MIQCGKTPKYKPKFFLILSNEKSIGILLAWMFTWLMNSMISITWTIQIIEKWNKSPYSYNLLPRSHVNRLRSFNLQSLEKIKRCHTNAFQQISRVEIIIVVKMASRDTIDLESHLIFDIVNERRCLEPCPLTSLEISSVDSYGGGYSINSFSIGCDLRSQN